jgi:hypothetical protein
MYIKKSNLHGCSKQKWQKEKSKIIYWEIFAIKKQKFTNFRYRQQKILKCKYRKTKTNKQRKKNKQTDI